MKSEHRVGAPGRLEIRITEKRFFPSDGESLVAIADLALDIDEGTFTCLIGPSGCGKTTTLRIILGLDRDYRGSIMLPRPDMRLAAVFQEPRLLPWRSVEENVRLVLGKREAGKPLDDLFEALGLADLRWRFPGELSLGQGRRVALARAFAAEPDLLLLDEPFVSLDAASAARMRRLLIEVWQTRPMTALMVTHNAREAVELADRLIFLTHGPARVAGEMAIALARPERTPAEVSRILADISGRFPGVSLLDE